MLDRELELSRIRPMIDQPVVKILTGMRGCGKTTLLRSLQQELGQRGIPAENIISVDLESLEAVEINTARRLQSYIKYRLGNPGRHYVFLDEIQNVPHWEQAIEALVKEEACDLYLASSAVRQSAEILAEILPGQTCEFPVLPLSFQAFASISTEGESSPELPGRAALLADYLQTGGLPLAVQFRGTAANSPLMQGALHHILLQDVIFRAKIRDGELLIRIYRYVLQHLGKPFAVKSIADFLKKRQRQASAETIANHLKAMEEAGLIWRVPRYDIKNQAILQSTVKYYLGDHGLAGLFAGQKSRLIAGILENIVYMELRRRDYTVSIGKIGRDSIDFLAEKDDRRLYLQIAADHADQLAKPLLQIKDQYPKIILSRDTPEKTDIQGIRCLSLADFLLDKP